MFTSPNLQTLQELLVQTRVQADIPLEKLERMQEIYLTRNADLYTENDLQQVRYYMRTLAYKFHLAAFSLEQLWLCSETKRNEVYDALVNSLDRSDVSDDELLLVCLVFENFLFQARSFLDFYMLYLCIFLRTGHEGSMSRKTFYKSLKRVTEGPLAEKAKSVAGYFEDHVCF